MQQSRLIAGAVLVSMWLVAPAVHAEDQPPPVPTAAGQPGPASPTSGAPGTVRGTSAPARPVPLPGVKTVLIFPFESSPDAHLQTASGRALGEALADAVQRGMDASKVYATVKFSPDSVLIERAAKEQSGVLVPAIQNVIDPVKGTVDQARAMQIAQRTGMEAIFLGSIEQYTYDKATNKVEMVATAQILDSFTGEPMRTAGVTGSATGAAGADESTVAQAAATDVAGRMLTALSVPPPPPATEKGRGRKRNQRHQVSQEEEGARHRSPGWVPAGILLGIIVGAVR